MKRRILSLVIAVAIMLTSLPVNTFFVYAEDLPSYADFISNTNRRDYVNEKIGAYLLNVPELTQALEDGKPAVFLFEGASDNLDTISGYNWSSNRVGAVCIVLRKTESGIIRTWYSQDCSTIPDRPLNYGTKDATHGPATTVDGVYDLYTVNHHGAYAAMNVRVDGDDYFPALYMSDTGGYDYITAFSINVHTRTSGNAVSSDTASPWSAGCILIGTSKSVYNEYMLEVNDGIYGTGNLVSCSSQYCSYYYSSTGTFAGKIVIDRGLAEDALIPLYKNSDAVSELLRYSKSISLCPHESYNVYGECVSCGYEFDWTGTASSSCMGIYLTEVAFTPRTEKPYDAGETAAYGISAGDLVEVLEEYENVFGEKWYKILYNGEIGYVPASCLAFVGYSKLEVTCADFSPANQAILAKKSQNLTGTVTSNYPLEAIYAYLDGTQYASWTASNENTYSVSLKQTDINYDLTFGSMTDGKHIIKLVAKSFIHTEPVTFHVSVFYTTALLKEETYPGQPTLNVALEGNLAVFTWDATSDTTHYNLLLAKQNESGEWVTAEQIPYAESGLVRTVGEGQYRAQLLAYNCGSWEEDGSDWLHTGAEDVYFGVHDWTAATCITPKTCILCGVAEGDPLGHSYENGICTACGAAENVMLPNLKLSYASLSFESEICYNLYFTASDLDNVAEMGLLVFNTQDPEGTYDTADEVISNCSYNGTYYMCQTGGVAAKKMGDALYFKVYARLSDGTYAYSDTVSYNAVSYAKTILNKSTNEHMKKLVVAMLNYGAEAQTYFGYNTDSLMNSGLTGEELALVLPYDADTMPDPDGVDSSKNGIFTNVGFGTSQITASFDAAFALNYYCDPLYTPDGDVTLYYWTAEDYAAADALSPENASGAVVMTPTGVGNWNWAAIPGIAAKEMGNTVYAGAVYESGGVTYSTVVMNYSMGRYCDTIAGRDDSRQQELSKATAVYGASAKLYFDNLQA